MSDRAADAALLSPPPPPPCCRRLAASPAWHCLLPLCRLGSYRGLGRENAIAKFSRHVLDALPKILLGGAGPGAAQQVRLVLAAVLEAVPMPGSFSAGTWHTILTRVPLRCSLKAGSSRKGSHPPAAAAVPVRLRRLPATARLGAAVSRGSSLLLSLAAAYPAQSVLLAPAVAPVVSVSKHPDVRHPPCSCLLEDGQRLAVLSDVQQLESELARSGSPGGWLQHTLLCTLRVLGRRERGLWLQP